MSCCGSSSVARMQCSSVAVTRAAAAGRALGRQLCSRLLPAARVRPVAAAAARGITASAAPQAAVAEEQPSSSAAAKAPGEGAVQRRQRVLSGVQPTGSLHLGNYLGAIRNWVKLQEEYDTYFCVVDLHAITLPHEPAALLASTHSSAALYIACGIDPAKANIFVQSHVPAHAELTWLLSCITPIGWLRKMIQFKEKSKKAGAEEVGTGLLTYPVLMAADILLYQSDLVPVGEDQRQHLELARDIAERTNYLYGGKKAKKMGCRHTRLFKVPEALIPPAGARVMSLQDGTSKMSKSAESDLSRINLLDSPDLIVQKVKRAKTDAFDGLEWDNPDRPEARNLLTIYQCVTGMDKEAVLAEVGSMRWGDFKPRLADALVAHLEPIQARYHEVMQDEGALDAILAKGADNANREAYATLDNVRKAMGFGTVHGRRWGEDLIKQVRQCKTAAEERDVIAKESAALRQAFKEQDGTYRHRNVAKLMYMHMLGYPTHFGQMETLKLIASSGFPEKRVGYLGLMILLDERQEVLMLVTNSLKNDLNSRNQYTVGLALCALGNICSAEMARDLGPEVERLLASQNPYLRKKAALCASRVLRKVPDMLESFAERAPTLLEDRSHSVLLAGVTLMLDICAQAPQVVEAYRPHVPLLCRVLRSLIMGGFAPDYDVGGINDPFLQVAILRLLRVLGRGSAEASDAMSDVLAQVATNTDSGRNAGNAILYECVQTIMAVESIGGLRVLAVNILGRFLGNKDNNIRYVALNTLARVVSVDAAAVQRHRGTIVDCVKDADISIRRRALELVYALVNEGNIRTLTRELLDYLDVCDAEFKPDLANKICMLVQRYAPDKRWYIDSLLQVLVQAGAYVKDDACRALILLVVNAAQLHAYAARASYRALTTNLAAAQPSLLMVSTWCLGEYGELLVGGAGGKLLEGEEPVAVGEADVVGLLEAVLQRPTTSAAVREYGLTALAKLEPKFGGQAPRIKGLIAAFAQSTQLEVQTRSVEYSRLFAHPTIGPQVLEHIPPLEESAYDASLEPGEGAAAAGGAAASGGNAAADLAALLGLDAGLGGGAPAAGSAPAAAPVASQAAAVSALSDLLAGDLLGGGSAAPPAAAAPAAAAAAAAADPLAGLFGAPVAAAPAVPAGPAPVTITAFQKGPLTVTFQLSKSGGDPAATDILASFSNSGDAPLEGFTLQAAVPKQMTLKLDPASAGALPPHSAGAVTQRLHVHNSLHGQKALVMRLRISYQLAGAPVLEQGEVASFPAGW